MEVRDRVIRYNNKVNIFMSTGTKRLPLNKAQSVGGQFINSSSNLDKSGFLESIKEDSHLFAGLATDKPEDVSIPRP